MDDCNKCESPRGSDTDSSYEKFRFEMTKKTDEDLVNIKKLKIQASNKSRESCHSNCDIDKKISDLECLIKRLQDELNDLACANKQKDPCKQEDECEIDFCCPVANECEESLPCPEEPVPCSDDVIECYENHAKEDNCVAEEEKACSFDKSKSEKDNMKGSSNPRFPIILRDIGHVQEQNEEDMSEENIFRNNDPRTEDIQEDIPSLKQNIPFDWDRFKEEKTEEEKPTEETVDTESITHMIAELRADIDETIQSLNKHN